ncbi:MAG: polyisoprenoid-binding protein [Burkholderiaceae bacterium]|nr:polyisoprenoid-binding protein [Burkholderiaceae bacterium]
MTTRNAMSSLAAIALLFTLTAAAQAQPVHYRFDPTHTFAHFELTHFGTSTIRGRLGPLHGDVEIDRGARRGRVQVEIDTSLASTGVSVLDARMREPDMLAMQAHPKAYLVAERMEFDEAGRVKALRGEFTLKGVSLPLTLTAVRFNCYTSPLFRREVCGGDFEGQFSRGAVGITHSLPFVSDTVRLLVTVEAIAQ